jgi:hypothetical protein
MPAPVDAKNKIKSDLMSGKAYMLESDTTVGGSVLFRAFAEYNRDEDGNYTTKTGRYFPHVDRAWSTQREQNILTFDELVDYLWSQRKRWI